MNSSKVAILFKREKYMLQQQIIQYRKEMAKEIDEVDYEHKRYSNPIIYCR